MNFSSEALNLDTNNVDMWNVIKNISITKQTDDAFYCCDLNDVVKKVFHWQKLMPRIQPFYAVKCNDHKYILKLLAALGLNFHCCSAPSLHKVLSLNIEPNRIIIANTAKPKSLIRDSLNNDVDLMTFDSKTELYKIKEIFPEARLVLRISFKVKAAAELGRKFGCNAHTEAPELLRTCRDLGLNVFGVSFHVGSGCQEIKAFYQAIKLARFVFNTAKSLGFSLNLLDIGGGFSGKLELLDECAEIINSALEDFFPEKEIKVISEPSTYFVETAFKLVCKVHSIREALNNDLSVKYNYYINDSIYGGFLNIAIMNLIRLPRTLQDHGKSKEFISNVWGITNDSSDRINKNIMLPKLNIDEWLVYDGMGHYSLPLYSVFSGIDIPKVFTIINNDNWDLIKDSYWFTNDAETINIVKQSKCHG